MKPSINHVQRNKLILTRARALFSELGYSDVTLQQLARHCGLSRTVIYRYYHSKREVFDDVISSIAIEIGTEFRAFVEAHPELTATDKLLQFTGQVLDIMQSNLGLLSTVTEYLIDQQRNGENVRHRVQRHTIMLRRTLADLVREGRHSGEFQPVNCNMVGEILFQHLEAAALENVVTQTANTEQFKRNIDLVLYCLKTPFQE